MRQLRLPMLIVFVLNSIELQGQFLGDGCPLPSSYSCGSKFGFQRNGAQTNARPPRPQALTPELAEKQVKAMDQLALDMARGFTSRTALELCSIYFIVKTKPETAKQRLSLVQIRPAGRDAEYVQLRSSLSSFLEKPDERQYGRLTHTVLDLLDSIDLTGWQLSQLGFPDLAAVVELLFRTTRQDVLRASAISDPDPAAKREARLYVEHCAVHSSLTVAKEQRVIRYTLHALRDDIRSQLQDPILRLRFAKLNDALLSFSDFVRFRQPFAPVQPYPPVSLDSQLKQKEDDRQSAVKMDYDTRLLFAALTTELKLSREDIRAAGGGMTIPIR